MEAIRKAFRVFSSAIWLRIGLAFLVLIAPVFLFVQLADEVRERETLPIDEAILHAVNNVSSSALDVMAVVVTQFGGVIGVTVLTLGAALLLWQRRMYPNALLLLSGVGGAVLLNVILKAFFQRDRPQLWERLVTENSYSFPSGHAMASSALALSLIVIFWPTRWRWLVVGLASLYMIVIGMTRLYLGVHYPTDVLAGWLVSAAWIIVLVLIVSHRTRLTALLTTRS